MCPDSLGEIRNRGGRSERHIEIKARRRRTKFCVRTAVLRGAVGTFSTQHDGADPISTNVPPDDPSLHIKAPQASRGGGAIQVSNAP